LAIVAVLCALRGAAAQELLSNPGFEAEERGRPGAPAGWSFESFYNGDVAKMEWTREGREGGRAVRIPAGSGCAGLKSAPFFVKPGQRYRVAAWIKFEPGPGARPFHPERSRFDAFHADASLQTFSPKGAADVTGQRVQTRMFGAMTEPGWRLCERVFTTPPSAAAAVLYLRFTAYNDGFWIDDVSVAPAPPLPSRIEFSQPRRFVPLTPFREDACAEDVDFSDTGATLAQTPNLAPNASFEAPGADGTGAAGWAFSSSAADRTFELDATAGRVLDGKRSARLSGGEEGWSELVSAPVEVNRDDEYVASVCYHFEGEGQPQLRLIGGDGQELLQLDLFRDVAPYPWLREELRLRPGMWRGARAKTARVAVRLYGQGDLWVDGVVLRKGWDRGAVGEKQAPARQGRLVSAVTEIGAVDEARLSWEAQAPEGARLEMFARVGPSDSWNPRTWTQWRAVKNGEAVFLPVRGVAMFMQWKAEMRRDEKTGAAPLLRRVVVERKGEAAPRTDAIAVGRMTQGFIDPRDLQGGWKKFAGWTREQIESAPEFTAFARDRAAGAAGETDRMAQVRALMSQQLVLYNAYLGAGGGVKGMELVSQGTGAGCGAVNGFYAEALKRLGMQARALSLGGLDGSGHSAIEAWSNEHNKWVFTDCFYGGVFLTREGAPLAMEEVFDLWRQDRMDEVTYAPWGAPASLMFRAEGCYTNGQQAPGPMRKRGGGLLGEFAAASLSGEAAGAQSQAPEVSCLRDGFPLERIHPHGPVAGQGVERDSVLFALNQTEITLTALDGGKARVSLAHNMPAFERFEIQHDEREGWRASPAEFTWSLAPGTNVLRARAVNALGQAGPAAEMDLRYDAALAQAIPSPAPQVDKAWRLPLRWRVAVDVWTGLYDRYDAVLSAPAPLETWAGAKVDPGSLRLVEIRGGRAEDAAFRYVGGELAIAAAGRTPLMTSRRFYLYFDEKAGEPAPELPMPEAGPPNWVFNGGFEESAPGPGGAPLKPSWLPFGVPPEDVEVKIIENAPGGKGRRCALVAGRNGQPARFMGPLFRIEADTPVEVSFWARSPSGQGSARVSLAPCGRDKRLLPWNTHKISAQARLDGGAWTKAVAYGLTAPDAPWGRLRIDVEGPGAWLDAITVRRRETPEAGPATLRIGEVERRAE